ncbi:MAG: hypothetical protein K0S55_1269 [Clostridia bacterium]|nr:hypothetical protein [Clostridia bacterium]
MKIINLKCNHRENPMGISGATSFSWCYEIGYERNLNQKAYRLIISLSSDFNKVDIVFDSGKIISNISNEVYPNNFNIKPLTIYFWKIHSWDQYDREYKSETASFETAFEDNLNWDKYDAKFINCGLNADSEPAAPLFHKEFNIVSEVKRARAYVFGLGWQMLNINNKLCGDNLLSPPNNQYDKRCLYEIYDITALLKNGLNLLNIQLGGGYSSTYSKWGWRWEGPKCVIAVIIIEYENGITTRIATDESWKYSESPIEACHIYHGEVYDARLEDNSIIYKNITIAKSEDIPKGKLIPNEMPHIKINERLSPVACWQDEDGLIYDLGQNIAGFVEIRVDAPVGSEIILKYSELISYDGMLSTWTNRDAEATDKYISSGNGLRTWHPVFTYHGFRYIKVTGIDNCNNFEICGCVVGADVLNNGSFYCSDPMINRIHQNILYGIRSNLYSIPTDCPQRDERTPCQMDSQNVEEAAIYNFDMDSYYKKWLGDIAEDYGNPDWSGDKFNALWNLYIYYNDTDAVRKFYDNCKAHIKKLESTSLNNNFILKDGFGDWCNPNSNTWDTFFGCVSEVNTALFYSMTLILSKFAKLLNKNEDENYYSELAEKIAVRFNETFYNKETGAFGCGKQTASLMPLYFGMVPAENEIKAASYLVNKIKSDGGKLDTGIFGTRAIIEVLAKYGYSDIVYSVLKDSEYPGFGWQIANGATTTWEQWSFKGGMHSHNHAMFSGIDASFYKIFGGLEPLEPGFKKFKIQPIMPQGMNFVYIDFNSISGKITANIEKRSDGTELKLVVPYNTTAEIYIPISNEDYIIFDGERLLDISKYKIKNELSGSYIKMDLNSGIYNLRTCLKKLIHEE